MPENVVSETDTRPPPGGVVVGVSAVASCGNQSRNVQFLHAASINERVFSDGRQVLIQISDVTRVILKCTEIFNTQPQIQSEIRSDLPIILRENREIVSAVLVIVNTPAAETPTGRALE